MTKTHDLTLTPEDEEMIAAAVAEGRVLFGRTCPTCGREFVPRRSHGVYCKTSCRVVAWQRRQRRPTG